MALLKARSKKTETSNQAALLKERGDLRNARMHFKVELPDTSSVHLRANRLDRLGFRLRQTTEQQMGLCVSSVSNSICARDTPVVEYNIQQERNRRSLYKVNPGDRIRAVNSSKAYDEMLRTLSRATDTEELKLSLDMERELEDVLQAPFVPMSPDRRMKSLISSASPSRAESRLIESAEKVIRSNGSSLPPLRRGNLLPCLDAASGFDLEDMCGRDSRRVSQASTRASSRGSFASVSCASNRAHSRG